MSKPNTVDPRVELIAKIAADLFKDFFDNRREIHPPLRTSTEVADAVVRVASRIVSGAELECEGRYEVTSPAVPSG